MTTTNNAFINAICQHIAGESQPVLEILYIGLSTTFDPPDEDSILEGEIARVAPTSLSRNNNIITIETSFDVATATTESTFITAVTNNSQFTVNDITGFAIGDRISVTHISTGAPEMAKIDNIIGSDIYLDEPIEDFIITINDLILQLISRVHIITGTATPTLNTGTAVAVLGYIETKLVNEELNFYITLQIR